VNEVARPLGPTVKRYRSEQDVETPACFIEAVECRFGPIAFDLAATKANAKAARYYTPETDALARDWEGELPLSGNAWCNPPFGNVTQWAAKIAMEAKKRRGLILLLVPASIGSNWFAEHVHPHAYVLALRPRITFVGQKDPFPRDLLLAVYGPALRGFDCWRWDRP